MRGRCPCRGWSGRPRARRDAARRATAMVSSVECPSTRITSSTHLGQPQQHLGKVRGLVHRGDHRADARCLALGRHRDGGRPVPCRARPGPFRCAPGGRSRASTGAGSCGGAPGLPAPRPRASLLVVPVMLAVSAPRRGQSSATGPGRRHRCRSQRGPRSQATGSWPGLAGRAGAGARAAPVVRPIDQLRIARGRDNHRPVDGEGPRERRIEFVAAVDADARRAAQLREPARPGPTSSDRQVRTPLRMPPGYRVGSARSARRRRRSAWLVTSIMAGACAGHACRTTPAPAMSRPWRGRCVPSLQARSAAAASLGARRARPG